MLLFDLNGELPQHLVGTFDLVIDFGTLEQCSTHRGRCSIVCGS